MIIYNVTIKVNHAIAAEWLRWMKNEHMPQLLETGCFSGHRLFRLLEQDDTEGPTYCAQYYCDTLEQYRRYMDTHVAVMRERSLSLWGSQFIAFRSVMSEEA